MKFTHSTRKLVLAGIVLSLAGVAQAADPTVPEAIARAEVMREVGKNMKVLGDMAGGKADFDAASAAAAKEALIAASKQVPTAFETAGEADPASESKAEIWTDWDDFLAKNAAFDAAVGALDVASVDGIKAGMGPIGASCKGCHSVYRQ